LRTVRSLYSRNKSKKGSFTLKDRIPIALTCVVLPAASKRVSRSMSLPRFISTSKSKCLTKSDPIIGVVTSAIIKFHSKTRRRPNDNLMRRSPNVLIVVPFAANNFVLLYC